MAKPRDSHVAVLAFPFGNHPAAIFTVTRRLASAAPTTVFSFFNTPQSNSSLFSSGYTDLPANIRVHHVADGVPEGHVFSKGPGPEEAIDLFLLAAPENLRREISAAEKEIGTNVNCILTDAFIWFAADIAAETNANWVAFWAGGPNSLAAHLYTDRIRETIGVKEVNARMEETLGFITGMEKIRVKDTPEGVVCGDLDSVFANMLHQMGLALPRASTVFINFFEELDPTLTDHLKSEFKRFLNIGPHALTSSKPQTEEKIVQDPHGCLAWMEKQAPASVAYIGFGTVVMLPPGEIVAIAEGLESRKVPFVWSMKEKSSVHLPKGFLERTREQGMVVPWAPQVELLKHEATGVFVTHGGWNSVLESVSGGVPMICRPFFGDHGINGRAMEVVWEIGVMVVDGVFTKDGFEKCLDRVLAQDDGKKMKRKAEKLKELAHEAVSVKGSSFENFKALLEAVV
ncbi:unnamed protein product [Microthlaspi erraticum]|uniref:Glycosyltransferase n=1 Tax=Microthlaspi erraticum TaxID=1685480 RepID=A0A6D2LCY5_9BRAS|nr:unnamed protein product [Microthlaspi erraticum]